MSHVYTPSMVAWLNQEDIHIFLLTRGRPFIQPADSLRWYSRVCNTRATLLSPLCSGRFSFLYNRCGQSPVSFPKLHKHLTCAHFLCVFFHYTSLLVSHTDASHFQQPKFSLVHRETTVSHLACCANAVSKGVGNKNKSDWSHLPLAQLCGVVWHRTDSLAHTFASNDQCIGLGKQYSKPHTVYWEGVLCFFYLLM